VLHEYKFSSRAAASEAAASRIAELIAARLAGQDDAATVAMVVSGGTTPAQCFELLSHKDLDWQRVQLVLSDERWVASDHQDSNERLIRDALLTHKASDADVLSVYEHDLSVDERCDSLQSQLPQSGFAGAMIGMGADGHFASLFPDMEGLGTALDTDNDRFYVPVRTVASAHPRVSMTLAALLQSEQILLLFFGAEKFAIYEQARAGDETYPITALLQQHDVPVGVYWAP